MKPDDINVVHFMLLYVILWEIMKGGREEKCISLWPIY